MSAITTTLTAGDIKPGMTIVMPNSQPSLLVDSIKDAGHPDLVMFVDKDGRELPLYIFGMRIVTVPSEMLTKQSVTV